MKLVLASHNADKLREFRQILDPLGVEVVFQSELGVTGEVEETGTTFTENAEIKALAAMEATGLPAVSDDSGLCIDALDGRPGVFSARFAEGKSYPEKCDMLIDMIKDATDRSAQFVAAIVCVFPDGTAIRTLGVCPGKIAFGRSGENGFGYDPIFIPDGYECTTADLSPEDKNAISHRGKALRELAAELERRGIRD